jgi:hypothetical protein
VLTEKHMYVAFGIKKCTLSIQVPDNARQGINVTEQSTKSMTRYCLKHSSTEIRHALTKQSGARALPRLTNY